MSPEVEAAPEAEAFVNAKGRRSDWRKRRSVSSMARQS